MKKQGPIHVVASVIQREGRYLLCRRPANKRHGGLWEFPGGKLEPRENHFQAAKRELAEELGVEVISVGEVLFSNRDPGSSFVIDFVDVQIKGEPQAREHSEIGWFEAREIRDMELAPSDSLFAQR